MFCPKCGKQIPDDSSFCMFCGKEIPQVFPKEAPVDYEAYSTPKSSLPVQAPTSPFGESDIEPLDEPLFESGLPFAEEDEPYTEPLLEPETFEPESFEPEYFEPETFMPAAAEIPDDFALPDDEPGIPHRCTLCGRELPASNITGLCVTCTNNRAFVPASSPEFQLNLNLDGEYPEEYRDDTPSKKTARKQKNVQERANPTERQKKRFPLFPLLIAFLLVAGLGCLAAFYLGDGAKPSSPSASTSQEANGALSDQERNASVFAQNMVKSKAANPTSVHFDMHSLSVSEKGGVWTVKQSFERLAPNGEMAGSSYTAVLKTDSSSSEGFKALMLQVDDDILYDYR